MLTENNLEFLRLHYPLTHNLISHRETYHEDYLKEDIEYILSLDNPLLDTKALDLLEGELEIETMDYIDRDLDIYDKTFTHLEEFLVSEEVKKLEEGSTIFPVERIITALGTVMLLVYFLIILTNSSYNFSTVIIYVIMPVITLFIGRNLIPNRRR